MSVYLIKKYKKFNKTPSKRRFFSKFSRKQKKKFFLFGCESVFFPERRRPSRSFFFSEKMFLFISFSRRLEKNLFFIFLLRCCCRGSGRVNSVARCTRRRKRLDVDTPQKTTESIITYLTKHDIKKKGTGTQKKGKKKRMKSVNELVVGLERRRHPTETRYKKKQTNKQTKNSVLE